MAINLTQLVDYAWTDIAKAAKMAMMNSALGGARLSINGHDIGRISIEEATKLYNTAQQMITADDSLSGGGGDVLVRFGEPR